MGISFNFDGDGFERQAWKQMKKNIERRVRSIRCPTHGDTADVLWTRGGGSRMPDDAQFEIRGCCEALAKLARDAVPD